MFKLRQSIVFGMMASAMLAISSSAVTAGDDRLRGAVKPVVAKKPYRIGVSLVHFVDDYWKGISYGIVEEAKETGVEIVRLLGDGGPIPYKQFLIPLYELTNANVGEYELTVFDQPPPGWQVPASQ